MLQLCQRMIFIMVQKAQLFCLFFWVIVIAPVAVFGAAQNQVVNLVQPVGSQRTCQPGQYLPGGTTMCKPCVGAQKYCPGGTFSPSDSDQGIFFCPTNTTANSDGSACVAKLSQDIMRYGAGGKNKKIEEQCWTKRETKDYAECVTKHIKNRTGDAGGQIKVEIPKQEQVAQELPAQK